MLICPTCRARYSSSAKHCNRDGTALEERETDPLIGTEVGRYYIESYIAEGATGAVYRATHSGLEAQCAVKVLFGELAADPVVVERFRREAQTASRIRSPYVVSVNDFGTTDEGLVYLVMEYAEGRSLSEVILEDHPIAPARVARILEHTARGLVAAHKMGFIHRDIKPSNILVQGEGENEVARITDFGIARPLVRSASLPELTQAGFVVGTPAYMAPEQAAGRPTSASDLYSLGAVLFHMLTGKKPFNQRSIEEILRAHATEDPPPIKAPAGLDLLTARLLSKRPSMRHRSAQALAEETRVIQVLLGKSEDSTGKEVESSAEEEVRIEGSSASLAPTVLAGEHTEMVDAPNDLFASSRSAAGQATLAPDLGDDEDELLFDDETAPSAPEVQPKNAVAPNSLLTDASMRDARPLEGATRVEDNPLLKRGVSAAPVAELDEARVETDEVVTEAQRDDGGFGTALITDPAVLADGSSGDGEVFASASPESEAASFEAASTKVDEGPTAERASSETSQPDGAPSPLPPPLTYTGHPAAMPAAWMDHPATAPTQWAQLYTPPQPARLPVWALVMSMFVLMNATGIGVWAVMRKDAPEPPPPSCVLADGFKTSALLALEQSAPEDALRDLTRALQLGCEDVGDLARLVAIAKNQQALAERAKSAEAALDKAKKRRSRRGYRARRN